MNRVIAPDRASLAPYTLPEVQRLNLLKNAVRQQHQHTQSSGHRQALALVGDGGMGKSVLLGQLLDYLTQRPSEDPFENLLSTSGAVVLVACASIQPGVNLSSLKAADEALGLAADPLTRISDGILGILSSSKSEYSSVTLLLDTFDLIISEQTLPALAGLIAEALDIGDVTLTCRTYEFSNYLEDARQSAPRLAHRLTKATLPKLNPHEILSWARLYLSASTRENVGDEAGFLLALEGGVERNGSLRQVCSVPVRLALTCDTYARTGHVPENLTVTDLYDAYWYERIERQSGRSHTYSSSAKESVALEIASQVVTSEGDIALQIPKGRMSHDDFHGLGLLASEGVIRDFQTSWEFFHQTFAEYANARWLLTKGLHSDEIERLTAGLRAGQIRLWPVAGSLLLQVREYSDYLTLAERMPIIDPEGARAHALAALRRPEAQALTALLERVQNQPELMLAVLPTLGDAPRQHLESAFDAALEAIGNYPVELANTATATLALLTSRSAYDDTAPLLATALDVLIDVQRRLRSDNWEHLPTLLVRALADVPVSTNVLSVLCERYASLGTEARQAVVQIHLRMTLSPDQVNNFAECILGKPCPPLADDEIVRVLDTFWNAPQTRRQFGWDSWRDLLSAELPRDWVNGQVKFVTWLAERDVDIRAEILTDLISGNVRASVSHVNVLKGLAFSQSQWVADWLLARPTPTRAISVGGIAQGAEGFTRHTNSATRAALIAWFTPGRSSAPRNVWAAQIILAAGTVTAHQQIFDELISSGEPRQVLDSALDAWIFQTPRHVLNELTQQLRALLNGVDTDTKRKRARLEGRLADSDVMARTWVAHEVLEEQSPRVAGTAIKTMEDSIRAAATCISADMVSWLGTLLSTVHTDTSQRLARLLGDKKYVDDDDLRSAMATLLPATLDRLRVAIRRVEDSQLARQLLDLLVRLDMAEPMSADQVRNVWDIMRSRVRVFRGDAGDLRIDDSAGFRDIAHLCGTLMARRLASSEVRQLVEEFLFSLDLDRFGNKIGKTLESLLVGLSFRDPEAITWMERIFGRPDASELLQLAIAKALLRVDGDQADGRAAQLKNRVECFNSVSIFIMNQLRS